MAIAMESSRRSELKSAPVERRSPLPSTERKVQGSFGFLLACLLAIATVSYISVVRMNQDDAWVDHTHQVISALRMLLATVTDGETAQRGYIITGQESCLEPYHSAIAHTKEVFRQVRDLTADNPLQQRRLNALEPLIAQRMAEFDEGIELRRKQGLEVAQKQFLARKGEQLQGRIRQGVAEMEETESMLLNARQTRAHRAVVVTEAVIIGTGLLALILVGLAQFLVRQGFMASRLSEAECEQRVRERTDELTQANVRLRDSMKALRKSRTMFENLFEFTPDAMVTTDTHGHITGVNTQAEKVFGYSRTELLGKPVELLVPERYGIAHAGHREKYGATPTSRPMGTGLELYGTRKDGTEFPADIQLSQIETGEGPLVLTVTRDITERQRADQEIRRLNAELEQRVRDRTAQLEASNKELEAFAYSVSHDLRAPVRHLSAFSESLRKRSYERLDEQERHYLDNIHASSQQMGTLIDDLLKFSRLGRAGMSKSDIALEPLVQQVRRALEPEVAGRTIVWKVSSLPRVYADPALLRQVFVNLMSNAVKYTRGRQEARVEIGCKNGTPGECVIFIRDNGVGFEMAYVDKLFKVFQRLHTHEFEGTGIGLANVRRIIERHGGKVWAEGIPEHGATFYFSVPTRGGEWR